jgi:hypothetical protein
MIKRFAMLEVLDPRDPNIQFDDDKIAFVEFVKESQSTEASAVF